MANITVRNIPDSVFEKIQLLSGLERRSINSELLIVIESGIHALESRLTSASHGPSAGTQIALWNDIAGKWKDKKPAKKLISEIYRSRSLGREVSL